MVRVKVRLNINVNFVLSFLVLINGRTNPLSQIVLNEKSRSKRIIDRRWAHLRGPHLI